MSVDITLGSITLPDAMVFVNEFDDSNAVFSDRRTIAGALVRQTGVKTGGRPINLAGGWTTRATVISLKSIMDAGTTSTLTLHDGTTYSVKIEAVRARPLVNYQEPATTDYYTHELELTEKPT